MRNYLVLFQPIGQETVATMRVIDAWATDGGIGYARELTAQNIERYRSVYGRGTIQTVEQGPAYNRIYI